MAKKRGNNEGTINKLPSGRWRAQITLEGRRLGCVFNTQREGLEWIRKTRGQIDDGLTFASTKTTLGEYLMGWLTSTKAAKRRSTWTHYEQVSRNYIIPNIGKIKIKDLRAEHLQGLYNHLLDQDMGTYTVRKIHTVLHSALQRAVKMGMIGRNPASYAQPPKEPLNEMAIFNESQVSHLLVSALGHRWEAIYYLAIVTGMRQMELLGLQWNDLDWTKQILRVERQLDRPHGEGIKFSPPKTKFGKRSIALGEKTVEKLRSHFKQQQSLRLSAGEKWQEYGLIFTNSIGGPIHPRNLLRDFKKLLNDSDLPEIRFHDLRHTAASLMLNHGVPVIIASRSLGHARPSITLDVYSHLIPSMQAEAAEMIEELIMPIAVQLDPSEIST